MLDMFHRSRRSACQQLALLAVLLLCGNTWGASVPVYQTYTALPNGTVIHKDTRSFGVVSVWDRCAVGRSGSACEIGTNVDQNGAAFGVEILGPTIATQYKGYTDWRAPTPQELLYLINDNLYTASFNPTIDQGFFPNTQIGKDYLSGNRTGDSADGRWNYVSVDHGQPRVLLWNLGSRSSGYYRLVRAGYIYLSEGSSPALGAVQIGSSGSSGATLMLSSSEAGHAFWLALPQGSPVPTAQEVVLGLAAGVGGSMQTGASEQRATALRGLQQDTPYDVYFAAVNDSNGGIGGVDLSALTGTIAVTPRKLTVAGTADNGTVASSEGLVWDQCSRGQSGSACAVGGVVLMDWAAAQSAVATANAANYKGYNNWRLPTMGELESLRFGASAPRLDTALFPASRAGGYWSASQAAGMAGIVDYADASSANVLQTSSQAVRLVRSGTATASSGTGLTLSQVGTSSIAPSAQQISATSSSGSGTLFAAVVPRGAAAPTATQMAIGSGYGGTWWHGSQPVGAGAAGAVALAGLDQNTAYDAYAVAQDASMQFSALNGPLAFTTISQYSQSLSFGSAPALVYGASATVQATVVVPNAGNPVVYSVPTTGAVCGVNSSSGLVTAFNVGSCTVVANLAGNADYASAAPASLTFAITQAPQTISLGVAPDMTYGGAPGSLAGVGGASGNPLVFASLTPAVCSVSGSTVVAISGGTCTVSVNQVGNAQYLPAAQASQSFSIAKAAQTIVPAGAPTLVVGGSAALAASAPAGAVAYSSITPAVCSISNAMVNGLSAGTCTVAMDQAGDARYLAAAQERVSFLVGKGNQTLQFGAVPTIIAGGSGIISINGGASTSPVLLGSLTPAVCTVSGTTVQGLLGGTCTVAANQAGDANYNAASQRTQNISVGYVTQAAVNLAAPASSLPLLDSLALSGSGGSGNGAIAYQVVSGNLNCAVAGSTLTAAAKGSCQVVAIRAGDGYYGAASSPPLSFTVNSTYAVQANGTVGNSVAPAGRTALVWDRCMLGGGGSNCDASDPNTGYVTETQRTDAMARVAAANASAHLGYTDWRLPSVQELYSLIDTSFGSGIDATTFPSARGIYWSATLDSGARSAYVVIDWLAYFNAPNGSPADNYLWDEGAGNGDGWGPAFVRLVRDGRAYLTSGTVPMVSGASVQATGLTAATLTATSDTAGTGYWLAVAQGATAPTAAQVVAGVTYGNVNAVLGGSRAVLAGSSTAFAIAGLTAAGAYDVYFAVVDPGLHLSALSGPYALGGPGGSRLAQSLSFSGPAPTLVYGASVAVQAIPATPNAGNAVVYSVPTTGTVCNVNSASGVVTALSVGTCTVAADMAGNASYDAAPQISQSIAVNPASQAALTVSSTNTTPVYGSTATLSSSGGSGTGAVSYASDSANCGVSGATLTAVAVGNCTITATKAADANYAAGSGNISISVVKASQTIGFGPAPSVVMGGTGTVSATGGASGNPVTFASSTTGVCTISGSTVTGVAAGTCTITANQAGNANYSAAPQVQQSFGISAAQVGLNPNALTFANQTVGTTSTAQRVTLTNTGTVTLTIGTIVSGNSVFAVISNNCATAASLNPASSCTFDVTYSPTSAVQTNNSISITSNAAGSPHAVSVTGTGTGVPSNAPVCTLTASPPRVSSGGTSILTASCTNSPTSYSWTGGSCAGKTGTTCTVTPAVTTSYGVIATNASGSGSASATVTVGSVDMTHILMFLLSD